MTDNRISLCMIVRDDAVTLAPLLEKLRPHVDEIVCVDTGSTDATPSIARHWADKFETYLACNDPATELIDDFAQARNRSYELASHPWALWLDGDDDIQGAENLRALTNRTEESVQYLVPYEYTHDAQGRVTCLHWRENLIKPRDKCRWQIPVHEVLIPSIPMQVIGPTQAFRRIHKKHLSKRAPDPQRNLRILTKYVARGGETDVRALYYYGVELHHAGNFGDAIRVLKRYVQLAGWMDEKCLAQLELARIYHYQIRDYQEAIEWAFRAMATKSWPEPYFMLCRSFYQLAASKVDEDYNARRALHWGERGIAEPDTQTVLFVNPMERYEIQHYLNALYSRAGNIEKALESVRAGMQGMPEDAEFQKRELLYEDFLTKGTLIRTAQKARAIADAARQIGVFDQQQWHDVGSAVAQCLEVTPALQAAPNPIFREVAPQTPADGCLDIALYLGQAYERWSPVTLANGGMGGSETMAWELAKRLRAIGHRVRVFADCEPEQEGLYDGVEWLQSHRYPGTRCDVLIASRRPDAVDDAANLTAGCRVLWVHDVHAGHISPAQALRFDAVLALSNWHKSFLLGCYGPDATRPLGSPPLGVLHDDQIIVTRNGIDLGRFDADGPRNPKRVVYSSSPDRGLTTLLEMWPDGLAEEPEAELHCYYGLDNWEKSVAMGLRTDIPWLSAEALRRIKLQLRTVPRVTMHGRINQEQLAREFLMSGVMAAAHWFSETFGIAFAEAQGAGLYIVTTPIAALNETVADRGIRVPGSWDSPNGPSASERKEFVLSIVKAIRGEGQQRTREQLQAYARKRFGLDSLAKDWDVMLRGILERVQADVVPAFRQ